jgi:DNA mismatch repair protein MutL
VLAESDEGLVLIDQHAAHERVLFEQMLARLDAAAVPSQRLLIPETVEFSHRDAAFLREHLDPLRRIGIGIEEFGANSYLIESLPDFLVCFRQKGVGRLTLQQIFFNIVDELIQTGADLRARRLDETAIATTVCRHAVKARDPLKLQEIENLLRDLAQCDLPYTCPHGRPTMIQISHAELEKKFGRKL